jgi:hypothetical protein
MRDHVAHFPKLTVGRRDQRLAFVRARLGELWIAARNQPLAGKVGVREFEQTALIKESELQLSVVDEGVDLRAF